MLVILDDVAGSGETMHNAALLLRFGHPGHILLAPLIGTKKAERKVSKLLSLDKNASYHPFEPAKSLFDSKFFLALNPDDQQKLRDVIGRAGYVGFSKDDKEATALSVAFSYMSPDNNNSLFAALFAQHFILNKQPAPNKAIKMGSYIPAENVEADFSEWKKIK